MRTAVVALLSLLVAPVSSLAAPGAVRSEVADRVARDGSAPVIVELAETAVPEGWLGDAGQVHAQRQRVVDAQIGAIYALGGSDAGPVRPYPVIPFMAVEVGPGALAALEASPLVRDVRLSVFMSPQLDVTVPMVQGDQAVAMGYDGTGQVIVVLDTGTDGGHQNFPPGKILDEACFADGATGPSFNPRPDTNGGDCPGGGDTAFGAGAAVPCDYHADCFHGTHVAGIAAGDGPQYDGVAIGAGLIPIQVFSQFPSGEPRVWDSDQDAALLYAFDTLRLSHDIAAVNLSLGTDEAFTAPCDAAQASTKAAIDQLRSVGIATVIATGNQSCSGTGCLDAISSPACISSAVSVSSHQDNYTRSGWANASDFTSLFAPGHTVRAPNYGTVSGYTVASGTSMATPHVAGAFAILRQALPTASVTDILTALQDSGLPVIPTSLGVNGIQIADALGVLIPECDDGIDDDGDGLVDLEDPGCDDATDTSEQSDLLVCDNGLDDDGDGLADMADPGCFSPSSDTESPACNDGIDNDGDGGIDYDGDPPDAECGTPYRRTEAAGGGCGLGPEIALLLPWLRALRRRRPRG